MEKARRSYDPQPKPSHGSRKAADPGVQASRKEPGDDCERVAVFVLHRAKMVAVGTGRPGDPTARTAGARAVEYVSKRPSSASHRDQECASALGAAQRATGIAARVFWKGRSLAESGEFGAAFPRALS